MAGRITPRITEPQACYTWRPGHSTVAILVSEGKRFGAKIRKYEVGTYLRWTILYCIFSLDGGEGSSVEVGYIIGNYPPNSPPTAVQLSYK